VRRLRYAGHDPARAVDEYRCRSCRCGAMGPRVRGPGSQGSHWHPGRRGCSAFRIVRVGQKLPQIGSLDSELKPTAGLPVSGSVSSRWLGSFAARRRSAFRQLLPYYVLTTRESPREWLPRALLCVLLKGQRAMHVPTGPLAALFCPQWPYVRCE
jgi:hypothetical protein